MSLPLLPAGVLTGQKFQASITEVRLVADTGEDFKLTRWKKCEIGVDVKKQGTNRSDGKRDGYTIGKEEPNGAITTRLDEYYELETWAATVDPTRGLGQQEFTLVVTRGNSLASLKKDTARVVVDGYKKSTTDDQGADMVDVALFVMNADSNGAQFVIYAD